MRSETTSDDIARGNKLRVMTYNVHSCIGTDRQRSVNRIARVIASFAPDIVALQELGEARVSADGEDQTQEIAHYLGMDYHFFPTINNELGTYGIAILSHLPMRLVKAGTLPSLPSLPRLPFLLPASYGEPRGVQWVTAMLNGMEIQVLNTHFSMSPTARAFQVQALLGSDWLDNPQCRDPVILCGDFNALPLSRVHRQLRHTLDDAQLKRTNHRPRGTYPSLLPLARIDHVYVDATTQVSGVYVPKTSLIQSASDHLPLIVDLDVSP